MQGAQDKWTKALPSGGSPASDEVKGEAVVVLRWWKEQSGKRGTKTEAAMKDKEEEKG